MSTENVKTLLAKKTNIPVSDWKRKSKKTLPNKSEVRIFSSSKMEVETIEYPDGHISFKEIGPNVINYPSLAFNLLQSIVNGNRPSSSTIESFEYNLIPQFFEIGFEKNNFGRNFSSTTSMLNSILTIAPIDSYNEEITLTKELTSLIQSFFNKVNIQTKYSSIGEIIVDEDVSFEQFMNKMDDLKLNVSNEGAFEIYSTLSKLYFKFENAALEFYAVEKDGLFYLESDNEKKPIILGGFIEPGNFSFILEIADLHLNHYPKDTCFDLDYNEEEGGVLVYIDSLYQPGYDNMGVHNTHALPFELSSEDMECIWTVDTDNPEKVKKAFIESGFLYNNFIVNH